MGPNSVRHFDQTLAAVASSVTASRCNNAKPVADDGIGIGIGIEVAPPLTTRVSRCTSGRQGLTKRCTNVSAVSATSCQP